ncbi:MAG: hypothetical protein HY049_11865 [Acidobacteria bacterium]|nr:hypothetical protein [Acidobacteriota bacterium]
MSWRIRKVSIAGATAKIVLDLTSHDKVGWFRWQDKSRQGIVYWVFEDGNWFNMGVWPKDWKDSDAVEVPLPAVPANPGGSSQTPVP